MLNDLDVFSLEFLMATSLDGEPVLYNNYIEVFRERRSWFT